MNKEQFNKTMEVLNSFDSLVSSAKTEAEMSRIQVLLSAFEIKVRNNVTNIDNNVSAFLAEVAAGVHGSDYKATITRLHKVRGKKAEGSAVRVLTPAEKLAAAFTFDDEEVEDETVEAEA